MKKIYLLAILLTVQQVLCAQVYKSITVNTAGQLSTLLTPEEKSTTTNLTVTGTINVNDIFAMDPYYMPVLSVIDMSQATIVSGTSGFYTYDSNAIPWEGFRNNTVLVSITLPNTITKIGSQAFQGCTNLESIVIPSSVTEIGGYCFQSCSGLQNVTIPASTTTIGITSFNGANCYITVDPANPNYLSENGIFFNKDKTQIKLFPASYSGDYVIPSTVTSILESAFYKCTKLTSVTIPASVTNSMNNSFYESSGAITVAASNPNFSSLDGILYNKGKSTLIFCPIDISGNITIPSTVTTLDSWAFSGCNEMETVTIPTATVTIPFGTFRGCSANIVVDDANTKFSSTSGVLYNKTKTQLLAIPITKTGIFAIPESVTYIDDYAFTADIQISGIYTTKTTPINIANNSFSPFKYIDKSSIVLYVPEGSASTYSNYARWNEFETIIESNGIFLEQTTLAVSNSGEQSQIEFEVIGGWSISSPNEWITYTPSAGVS
ncbi:MAG TPA: leucine-rich repeat protein, partial [Bacteroidales bacterium]|nr:leucine-rich repeat protein [Bacteroidales bacterium]